MRFNSGLTPAFLWLTSLNHVSAVTPRDLNARQPIHLDEPILNHLLPRQQPITTTTIYPSSPLPTTKLTTTTASTTTTSYTTRPHNHNIAVSPPTTNTSSPPSFHPSTLKNIPIGDTLTFYFYPQNYSIVQSSYELPCQPLGSAGSRGGSAGGPGWFSGWHPTGSEGGIARSKFVVTVGSGETVWVYGVDGGALAATATSTAAPDNGSGSGSGSAGKTACELGLVMVVNPLPKGDGSQTLGRYKSAAAALRNGVGGTSDAARERWVEVARNVSRVPDAIWGGEVSGVSDKEKSRWEGRHPDFEGGADGNGNGTVVDGLVAGNGTSTDDGGDGGGGGTASANGDGKDVQNYKNGSGGSGKTMGWKKGSGWMGILVVLGVGVLGLGF